jgi:hypothetical protein
MRSLRWMRIEKSRTIGSTANVFAMLSASATSLPDISASAVVIVTVPSARRCSRKSLRKAASSPTRRMLRLRRAVTP